MKEEKILKDGFSILNSMISATFTRYNDLTEEEFLERLKVSPELSEDRVVKSGIYNILMELTKEIFRLQQKTDLSHGMIKLHLEEKQNEQKK